MNTVQKLKKAGVLKQGEVPSWLPENIHYETIMGSVAYGVSSDTSDMDVYGFCIPKKELVFPHLAGEIDGFGSQKERFEQLQKHGIRYADELGGAGRVYDLTIYNIVKYFDLCMQNNPNMIDSLFTPVDCVLSITKIGNMVRDARDMFLHKGCWHKFKGYAYSQIHKMDSKDPKGKRRETIEKYGYDVKFAYHVVRLLNEVEMIMTEGTLDLRRNREQLKSIRRGEWTQEEIRKYFDSKERELETLYTNCSLPYKPDEGKIKQLLLNCLEEHYGSLEKCVVNPEEAVLALQEINLVLQKHQSLLG